MTTPIGLIALDLDGTVLRPDRTISDRVRAAIGSAGARVPVVIASARPPRSVRAIARALGLATPQVCYNGALTWDMIAAAAVAHVPLAPEVCGELIAAARAVSDVVVSIEHLDRWLTDRVDLRFVTETGRLFGPDVVAPLSDFSHLGATKLMLHGEPAEIDRVRAALEPAFAGRATFLRTDPDLLQAIDPATSKWRAVAAVARSFDVTADAVLAIGDNENDREMIAGAGVGVAVANGTEAARAAADWIAPSNVDDGVAVAIERFVLAG
jgi:Cof subfamily protein (haloacid dehalogenase superfamily)